ncbi:NUDIX hydrolase [Danxiaibacter flavus]|uniref:GDP-mannose pyrophosphatase n=1 Tax=Danxiaibacter flavus TaxID=3049108 RepID=A0ABV3ZCU6_9BACT|nr:NUDIX hydrolase [Chitinophagaceae bacterium DXS]
MNEQTNPWTILGSREKYDNKWINVTEYDVINPSGGKGIYGKVHFKNVAIGVMVLDEDMNTYLVGQFRFTLDQYSWEIPEGGGPFDEQPLEAAKRELLEETGLKAAKWTKLIEMHLSNSISDELSIVYLAQELSMHNPDPEETEQLMVKKIPFDEAYEMVTTGKITDSVSVTAILKVKIMLLEGGL